MPGVPGELPRFDSMVEALRWRAQRHPERRLYAKLEECEIQRSISYEEADRHARGLALRLREYAEVGDRALLLYPYSLEYPVVFLACLYAGIVAVPAYPPDPGRASLRETIESVGLHVDGAGTGAAQVVATDLLEIADPERWRPPTRLRERLAFLQYTSGSTRSPRGVMIAHENLIEHQRLAHPVFARPERNVTVSWLPFYHDMGLIGSLLYPLYSGGSTLLMSPTAFLRRPVDWLRAISRHRAGVSTGPNFAYDACVHKSTPEDLESLDLSCWELTVCGAEPLRADTLNRFAACGFREEVFLPCYGMAEATLMVSGSRVDRKPRIDHFERRPLGRNVAVLAASDDPERCWTFVACGEAMKEHTLRIVDVQTLRSLPDGRVGEIWLAGPSVGRGYWGREEETQRTFAARLVDHPREGPYLRTGDTGFLLGGELYVTGRLADLIVEAGALHQPHDLERTARASDPSLATAECAAFLAPVSAGEQDACDDDDRQRESEPVIALDARRNQEPTTSAALARAIQDAIARAHGLAVRVVFVPPRSVAKTSSGKLRRHAYRAAYLDGTLERLHDEPRGRFGGR